MLTLSRLCILSFCYLFFVCQDIIGYFPEKYLIFLQQGPPVRPEDEWPLVWVTSNTWSIANTPIHCDGYVDYVDHDWIDANAFLVSVNFGTPTHCTKNTNKWVNSQQNSRDWPKGCQNMPKFCVLCAEKSPLLLLVAAVSNISYVSILLFYKMLQLWYLIVRTSKLKRYKALYR